MIVAFSLLCLIDDRMNVIDCIVVGLKKTVG